jgi:hypothetical protein
MKCGNTHSSRQAHSIYLLIYLFYFIFLLPYSSRFIIVSLKFITMIENENSKQNPKKRERKRERENRPRRWRNKIIIKKKKKKKQNWQLDALCSNTKRRETKRSIGFRTHWSSGARATTSAHSLFVIITLIIKVSTRK